MELQGFASGGGARLLTPISFVGVKSRGGRGMRRGGASSGGSFFGGIAHGRSSRRTHRRPSKQKERRGRYTRKDHALKKHQIAMVRT